MRLLVGLGNPGARYERTRHNIGFMAADAIVRRHGLPPFKAKFQGEVTEGLIGGVKTLVLKPQTFMNLSGDSVGAAARFYKIEPKEIAVLHDELDLAPGKMRVKQGGGAAGHNGLRSIDAALGPDYWRVRLGIGHPGAKELVLTYVLQNFASDEQSSWLPALIDAVAEAVPLLAADDAPGFMSKVTTILNPRPPKPPREAPTPT